MAVPVPDIANQTTASATPGDTIILDVPDGTQVGDFLLIIVGNDDSTADDQWTSLDGWELIQESGDGASDAHLAVFHTVADATLISTGTVTVTAASSQDYWGIMVRVVGVDTADPINVVGAPVTDGSGPATHVIPSVTTDADDCLAIGVLAFDGGDGVPFDVSGDGWNEGGEAAAGSAGSAASGYWVYKAMPTAGATGNATVTPAVSDDATHWQFALNSPAAETPATVTPPAADATADALASTVTAAATATVTVPPADATADAVAVTITTATEIELRAVRVAFTGVAFTARPLIGPRRRAITATGPATRRRIDGPEV